MIIVGLTGGGCALKLMGLSKDIGGLMDLAILLPMLATRDPLEEREGEMRQVIQQNITFFAGSPQTTTETSCQPCISWPCYYDIVQDLPCCP